MATMMLMKINLTMTVALLVKSIAIKIISAFDFTTFFTFLRLHHVFLQLANWLF